MGIFETVPEKLEQDLCDTNDKQLEIRLKVGPELFGEDDMIGK
jgi:hypothetical protein